MVATTKPPIAQLPPSVLSLFQTGALSASAPRGTQLCNGVITVPSSPKPDPSMPPTLTSSAGPEDPLLGLLGPEADSPAGDSFLDSIVNAVISSRAQASEHLGAAAEAAGPADPAAGQAGRSGQPEHGTVTLAQELGVNEADLQAGRELLAQVRRQAGCGA